MSVVTYVEHSREVLPVLFISVQAMKAGTHIMYSSRHMSARKRNIDGGGCVVTMVLQTVGASRCAQLEATESYNQNTWRNVCIRDGAGLSAKGVDWGTNFATWSFYLKFKTGNSHAQRNFPAIYFKSVDSVL